jgi:hypothetical protein
LEKWKYRSSERHPNLSGSIWNYKRCDRTKQKTICESHRSSWSGTQAVQDNESEESLVAPNTQYRDEQDREIGPKASELFGCFDPGKDKQHAQYDLINDIGIYPRTNDDEDRTSSKKAKWCWL